MRQKRMLKKRAVIRKPDFKLEPQYAFDYFVNLYDLSDKRVS